MSLDGQDLVLGDTRLPRRAEHTGDRVAPDVRVYDPNPVALLRQRDREVRRQRGLADASLPAGDRDDLRVRFGGGERNRHLLPCGRAGAGGGPRCVAHAAMLAGTWRAVLLAVLAVGLAGCRLEVGVDLAVDRVGEGVLAVVIGADEELLARATEAGVDPLEVLVRQRGGLADAGWRVSVQPRDGGGREVRLSAGFDGAEELNVLTAGLADALAAPEVRLLEPFTLQLTDEEIAVAGAAGLELTPATAALGIRPEEAVELIRSGDAVAYDVRVRLPGALVSTSGTERSPGVAVWEIEPGERVEIRVVGERPGPPILPTVLAGIVALAASAVAYLAVRRRARGRTGE